MSKYQPLESHLRRVRHENVPMTFDEIEKVIGAGLPASAFKHRAWWSNNPSNSVITHAWLDAGYKSANVDIPGRRLVFRRVANGSPPSASAAGCPPEPGDAGLTGGTANSPPEEATGGSLFSRIYGALKGTVTIRPGTDLTAPVDTEWDAAR